MRIPTLIFIFSLSFSIAIAQNNSPILNRVIAKIEAINIYQTSSTVGFTGQVAQQFILLDSLVTFSENNFLLQLAAHHKNAVVRLYCYKSLLQKQAAIPILLKQIFIKDADTVLVANGCLLQNMAVKDVFADYFIK